MRSHLTCGGIDLRARAALPRTPGPQAPGLAAVPRDGRAWRMRWSRPNPDSGTTCTLPSGTRKTFTLRLPGLEP